MYNFALAFVLCAVVYIIGDMISTATKAWIPSVFVTAAIVLVGYWTVLPKTFVSDSALIPFGSTIGIYLLITHMGTVISFKQLVEQWKTIVVCLAGLVGMCALAFLIGPQLMDRSFVISGLPPLTGGIVAATTMMDAAKEAGLMEAAVFAIAMYCIQGFAGYPLTAVCLQFEGKKLLKQYRSGTHEVVNANVGTANEVQQAGRHKLLPGVPDKWNSTVLILGKLGLVGWMATQLGGITIPLLNMKISGAVWALVLGIFFTSIGFLEENSLNKSNSYGILMFALMMYIFDGLKDCTPEMLANIIGPMILLIVIGVLGMAALSFVAAKILKMSFPMAFATALTALYGFPPNAVITENTCDALAKTPEEKEFLMSHMFPPMIVGGFTTVTITSVIIAGVFAGMF
ncbi:MAG: hypothetical protein PUJ57_01275 [Peptoniphilaceae bacterium]|nr:hypothetical protein [Peptoniphilaceae bacterium]MDY6085927.1 hypothetical protein [Peptoniphilaceae bacterium]